MVMMMLDSGPRLQNRGDFGCILDLQLLEGFGYGAGRFVGAKEREGGCEEENLILQDLVLLLVGLLWHFSDMEG